jgi:transposase
MIALPPGTRVYVACGVTDMRRGFDSLAAQVQTALQLDPYSGALFIFRGRRGDLLKALFWDGQGLVLYAKRLERGRFVSYGLCQPLWAGAADRPLRGRLLSDAHDPHG